jgi:pimeloyl-[acyl-carrier protein] methyl ester esterase
LHGWGFHGGVWDGAGEALSSHYRVSQIDLPGHGRSGAWPENAGLESLSRNLAEKFPQPAIWLGWSLGGLLALDLALRYPQHVAGLILVAASPRFTQAEDWPHATARQVLQEFSRQLQEDSQGTLQRFLGLQVRGADSAREQLRILRPLLAAYPPRPEALAGGLRLLAESDLRAASATLRCPVLLILGQRDTLVPADMARDWRAYLPGLRSRVIPGASHVPFLSHPQQFAACVGDFLTRWS